VAKQQTVVEQRASLEQQQQSVEQTLHEAKSAEHQAKANVDQQLVRQQTLASQRHFLQRGLERLAAELAAQREKLEQLELQRSDGDEPLEAMRAELTQVVAEQAEQEQILSASRAELNIFADQKNELQQQQQSIDNQLSAIRESTESARIALQTAVVKLQTFEQNITEQGFLLEVLQEQLSEEAEYALWQEKIASQETRISRLGPINLAAIDEHKQVTERKEYLDQQQVDLESALGMLESAIEKIDKETRSLFRDTFNAINEEFQTLFPKVFSGGKAVLEMTENDLLKTGVIVRAQPPGKRNSTIHLLSGGEKALTALALVFSLFKSNPAPFCLLDEVDAPLDEANVGRFCHLVEEMAKEVQFIIVTHNKATMQRMHQLNGVTMREPGVTRLVSVDIAEAVELAEQN
jgi:chromosome segregation protein